MKNNRRIMIIGVGYVGAVVTKHLQDVGHEVSTVDILSDRDPGLRLDYRSLRIAYLKEFTDIVWLAGHSSVGQCRGDPSGAVENNVTGLAQLAGKLTTQRLIFASSVSVHARAQRNMYDATKRAAEEIIPVLYPYSWGLRFGTVCGVSPQQRWDIMIPAMYRSARENGVITVTNKLCRRPLLGVWDLARAIEVVIDGEDRPGLYDLASLQARIDTIGYLVAEALNVPLKYPDGASTYDIECQVGPFLEAYDFEYRENIASIVADLRVAYDGQPLTMEI